MQQRHVYAFVANDRYMRYFNGLLDIIPSYRPGGQGPDKSD
ncbi:MAG: hypothetical protein VB124_04645 [Burkholderia sp.]